MARYKVESKTKTTLTVELAGRAASIFDQYIKFYKETENVRIGYEDLVTDMLPVALARDPDFIRWGRDKRKKQAQAKSGNNAQTAIESETAAQPESGTTGEPATEQKSPPETASQSATANNTMNYSGFISDADFQEEVRLEGTT